MKKSCGTKGYSKGGKVSKYKDGGAVKAPAKKPATPKPSKPKEPKSASGNFGMNDSMEFQAMKKGLLKKDAPSKPKSK